MSEDIATIKVAVEHGHLKLIRNYDATAQSINSIQVEFEFRTSDWNDVTKTASFFRQGIDTQLVMLEDDQCLIPWETLDLQTDCHCGGFYEIGLIGVGNNNFRITTNRLRFTLDKSGYVFDSEVPGPSLSVYEQLIQSLMSKSNIGHTHDDRYYTESEIDDKIQELIQENYTYSKQEIDDKISDKVNKPKEDGEEGQYLFNNGDGTTSWKQFETPLLNAYSEIHKIKPYLYSVYYEKLNYNYAQSYFSKLKIDVSNMGCSSIRNGNFVGRQLDWTYDNNAEFVVTVPRINGRYASIGVASGFNFADEDVNNAEYNEIYEIIPFRIVDGMNEKGVFVNTNVVPTDKGISDASTPTIEERESICNLMLIRFILDNFDTAKKAVEYIRDYVSIYPPNTLTQMGYEAHYMILDLTETYLLEIIGNEVIITNMTAGSNTRLSGKPYMTNFYLSDVILNQDGTVYTPATQSGDLNAANINRITPHGSGLERYNLIATNYNTTNSKQGMKTLLNSLTYTNAYRRTTNPFWYTEFVGINNLKVTSAIEDYSDTVDAAIELYERRTRLNHNTWQTVHSSLYDLKNRKLYLITQEDGVEYEYNFDWSVSKLEDNGSVKVSDEYKTAIDEDGILYAEVIDDLDYSFASNNMFVSKGTLDNVINSFPILHYTDVMRFKGVVTQYSSLPSVVTVGDVYYVETEMLYYIGMEESTNSIRQWNKIGLPISVDYQGIVYLDDISLQNGCYLLRTATKAASRYTNDEINLTTPSFLFKFNDNCAIYSANDCYLVTLSITQWNIITLSDITTIISNVDDLFNNINSEITNRQNADNNLQSQIDALSSASDVVDVVGTYEELISESYDTSYLKDNDIVKVLSDSTQNDAISYYRWNIGTESWVIVGTQGPFYTKSEADIILNNKVDKVSGKGLSTNDYTTAEKGKLAGLENYDDSEIRNLISQKQDELTAGEGIKIIGSTISFNTSVIELMNQQDIDDAINEGNTLAELIQSQIEEEVDNGTY